MKNKLKLIPLEERIVLDAAVGAAIAHAITSSSSTPHIIYVNESAAPGGNGSSWAHAYNSLQSALTAASGSSSPEQIWIAEGTYTPSQVYSPSGVTGGASGLNTPQLETFNLPNNVTLIGGFVAGDTSISQSDPSLHPTILNGSLGNGTDVYHVVTLGNDVSQTGVTATLENLTIENGDANGPSEENSSGGLVYGFENGGGIYESFGSNLTLDNVTLAKDSAALATSQQLPIPPTASGLEPGGGGIFVYESTLTVNDSTFTQDTAGVSTSPYGDGGAINADLSSVTINNSNFQDNSASTDGGAVAIAYATNTISINNSVFNGNSLTNPTTINFDSGGALEIFNSSMNLDNSVLTNNTSTFSAGAIMIDFQADFTAASSVNLNNDTLSGNSASYEAGAMTVTSEAYANAGDLVTVTNSKFLNNYSGGVGGGIDIDSINVDVNSTLFEGNVAKGSAGALNSDDFFNTLIGTPLTTVNLNNDTFLNNIAQGQVSGDQGWTNLFSVATYGADVSPGGGAVESIWSSQINISNSTFVGNEALGGNGGAILNGDGNMYLGSTSYIVATGSTMTLTDDTFVGNSDTHGNGGAVASLIDTPGLTPPDLVVKDSTFSLNSASTDGGAIYLNGSDSTIQGDSFLLDLAPKGSEVWATDSTINGEASSSATAAHDLELENTFYLLYSNSIILS
jgi:predicted outer membrane repeat protein